MTLDPKDYPKTPPFPWMNPNDYTPPLLCTDHVWDHYIGKESLKYVARCLICRKIADKDWNLLDHEREIE